MDEVLKDGKEAKKRILDKHKEILKKHGLTDKDIQSFNMRTIDLEIDDLRRINIINREDDVR